MTRWKCSNQCLQLHQHQLLRKRKCPSGVGPPSADLDPPQQSKENGQEFGLMSGGRSFMNLFHDSRTPLDSIRNKLVTLIYFVIVQCPSVGTTWYSARDLRLPRRTSGSALSADCQTLDVFVIVKVLFRIPQQLIIVKIRK